MQKNRAVTYACHAVQGAVWELGRGRMHGGLEDKLIYELATTTFFVLADRQIEGN